MTLRVTLALVAVLSGAAAAQAPAPAVASDTALERRVNEIAANLRCPVCQGLSIVDSPSELAQDMKRLVREQVVAGRSRADIEGFFVQRYGEWVLLKPPARGANLTVWLGPAVLLLAGAVVLTLAARRWMRQTAAGPAAEPTGTSAELVARRERLRQSLAELDADLAAGKITAEDHAALRARDEAELAAVRAALHTAKPQRAEAAAAPPPAGRRRQTAAAWIGGTVLFGAVAVLTLRGAVAPREEGGTITGIQFGEGSSDEDAALAALEARVGQDSTDFPALIELGHRYLQRQQLQKAADVSMKAVQLRPRAPETAEAFAHLGMILFGANELDAGLQSLEQALLLSPDLPEALLYKGILMFAGANNPAGAVSAWERYLAVAPPGAETARVRGMLEAARQAARD